jgi:hypothetical protein
MELLPSYENGIRLVKVDGRIYRKCILASQTNPSSSFGKGRADQWSNEYEDDEDGRKCGAKSFSSSSVMSSSTSTRERECIEDNTIVADKNTGGFETKLVVPSAFHKFLIGKGGATRNKIQKDTGATLQVPPPSSSSTTNDFITIKGKTAASVSSAKTRVEVILQSTFERAEFSHFLCFPLIDPSFQQKMKQFIEELNNSEECSSWKGYDPSIAISPLKLHLTICMLKLYSKESIETASRLLQG